MRKIERNLVISLFSFILSPSLHLFVMSLMLEQQQSWIEHHRIDASAAVIITAGKLDSVIPKEKKNKEEEEKNTHPFLWSSSNLLPNPHYMS